MADETNRAENRHVFNDKGGNHNATASQPDRKTVAPTLNHHNRPAQSVGGGDGDAAVPSGYNGENPATAGPEYREITSEVPTGDDGRMDPSSPTAGTEGPSTNLGGHNPDKHKPGREGGGRVNRRATDSADKAA